MRIAALVVGVLLPPAASPLPLAAQSPPDVGSERAEYVAWLETAPNSPRAAVAQQPIGDGLRLGPADADIPLDGVSEHTVSERGGTVRLAGPGGSRLLPRVRPTSLGRYTIAVSGGHGRKVLTVFGDSARGRPPEHYPYDPALVFEGPLVPPDRPERVLVLGVDGIEAEAVEAGTVTVTVAGRRTRLRVRRIPTGDEESELEIYFRDGTTGAGTYPAGRFVSLVPLGEGRYRLDFNRARNPFCAYSTAYPCPAPWGGNVIGAPVRAGERYSGGGLETPPAAPEAG